MRSRNASRQTTTFSTTSNFNVAGFRTCFFFFFFLRFEVFTVVTIQVEVFCVVTQCSVMAGYQRFGGSCCLHLQGEVGHGITTQKTSTCFIYSVIRFFMQKQFKRIKCCNNYIGLTKYLKPDELTPYPHALFL